MATNDDDDEVGYKKPPRKNQFKKGQSGNPKGRSKGARNFSTELAAELNTRIPVTENGKRKKLTKRKVITKQVVGAAMAGDAKALAVIVATERAMEAKKADVATQELPLAPEDNLVMAHIMARVLAAHGLEAPNNAVVPQAEGVPAVDGGSADAAATDPGPIPSAPKPTP